MVLEGTTEDSMVTMQARLTVTSPPMTSFTQMLRMETMRRTSALRASRVIIGRSERARWSASSGRVHRQCHIDAAGSWMTGCGRCRNDGLPGHRSMPFYSQRYGSPLSQKRFITIDESVLDRRSPSAGSSQFSIHHSHTMMSFSIRR